MSATSPLSPRELVDEYFIENRTRLLEIAAFLDRIDRADPSYAGRSLEESLERLGLDRIQLLLSDPRHTPLESLDRKSAIGAFDRSSPEARS